jgi:nucleoside 2-deoxyribosyltransferase
VHARCSVCALVREAWRRTKRTKEGGVRVYLGGPINGCTDAEAKGWRDELASKMKELGYEPVDPMRRDYRGRELEVGIVDQIVSGDLADIESCDATIFNCPKPSYGTAMEMFFSFRAGKRVIVVLPDDGAFPSPWVVAHSHAIVRGNAERALDLLHFIEPMVSNSEEP